METGTHKHRCGETMYGYDSKTGCGHVWEHPDPTVLVSEEEYQGRHVCPACGAGPWLYKYMTKEEEDQAVQRLMDSPLLALLTILTRR